MSGEEERIKRDERENEKRISHKNIFWLLYRLIAEREVTEEMLFSSRKE